MRYPRHPAVSLGQGLELSLNLEVQNIPAMELSNLEGFQARYFRGPSTRMSIVNGQVSSPLHHIYSLPAP